MASGNSIRASVATLGASWGDLTPRYLFVSRPLLAALGAFQRCFVPSCEMPSGHALRSCGEG